MMFCDFELTKDDIAQLAPIGKSVFGEEQEPHFVEKMVFGWGNFVRNLGDDFDTNIYDYQNDVWVRQSLEELLRVTPEPVSSSIKMFVHEIDQHFLKATHPSPQPITTGAPPDQWWWWRLPNKFGKELREDLIDRAIIFS